MLIYIYGTGGCARETAVILWQNGEYENFGGFVDLPKVVAKHVGRTVLDRPVLTELQFIRTPQASIVVAVSSPVTRRRIVDSLPAETSFASVIHRSALVGPGVELGRGAIIGPGCNLTTNIRIGDHAQINHATFVGHDCVIGDYFTAASGVHISGACKLANDVYFGAKAAIRQGLCVGEGVTIGMGAMVVRDCRRVGSTYVGVPAKLLLR